MSYGCGIGTQIGLFESIVIIENVTRFHVGILYNDSEIEILLRRKKNRATNRAPYKSHNAELHSTLFSSKIIVLPRKNIYSHVCCSNKMNAG